MSIYYISVIASNGFESIDRRGLIVCNLILLQVLLGTGSLSIGNYPFQETALSAIVWDHPRQPRCALKLKKPSNCTRTLEVSSGWLLLDCGIGKGTQVKLMN